MEYELYHYGVKGMKWGVRRYQNKDGTLTPRGIKRYAKVGYAQDSYRNTKTRAGKFWAAYTGAHRIHADNMYETSSKKKNKERAEKYLRDKEEAKAQKNKKAAEVVAKGTKAAAGTLAKLGTAYVADQVFYNGMGTTVAKETIRAMGMATITAYTMARGGYDIKWYDKQGRRVG